MPPFRVLIVDDEVDFGTAVADYLDAQGFSARHVPTASAALDVVEGFAPDLVLLDLVLGADDGLDLARRLLALHPPSEGPAILFLSGRASMVDRVLGLELGGDGFIEKPVSMREIKARVGTFARRAGRGSGHAAPVPLGRSAVDFAAQTIIDASGQETRLSPGEIAILRHFLHHRGKTLTREDLLAHAPASDEGPFDRTIDARIARLRRKIGADGPSGSVIETVWGVGYRLRP